MPMIVGEGGEAILGREYQRAADLLVRHAVQYRAADAVAGVIVSWWSLRIRLPSRTETIKVRPAQGFLNGWPRFNQKSDECARRSQARAPLDVIERHAADPPL